MSISYDLYTAFHTFQDVFINDRRHQPGRFYDTHTTFQEVGENISVKICIKEAHFLPLDPKAIEDLKKFGAHLVENGLIKSDDVKQEGLAIEIYLPNTPDTCARLIEMRKKYNEEKAEIWAANILLEKFKEVREGLLERSNPFEYGSEVLDQGQVYAVLDRAVKRAKKELDVSPMRI